LQDGELVGVAEVMGSIAIRALITHQAHETVDEVVHVAKRSRLRALAVNRQRLPAQGLRDEVTDDPAIGGVHARAIGVEDADHADIQPVAALVVVEERLGTALALVITTTDADGVDVAPVVFALRVLFGIAVDLAGAGLEDAGPGALGQTK